MRRWMGSIAAGLALAAGAAEGPDEESFRASMEKWVEARRLVSREREDWRLGREILDDRIHLVQREIEAFREKTAQARNDIRDADRKLAELTAQNDELKAATADLGTAVTRLEARVLALLDGSPAPIRERVRPLSQRIPRDPAETKMSLSERFQNVVGILNEVNKFSREILVASETRDLGAGISAEVTTLYLGLGQAYYANPSGIAGIGRPGPAGWTWIPSNAIAQAVADAVAIHRNEKPAAYVPLPLEVK